MKSVHFKPWVGDNYNSPSLNSIKIMILGESHYGVEDANNHNLTIECVQNFQTITHKKNRFFDMVCTGLLGYSNFGSVKEDERVSFWNDVIFYNFIQEYVNDGPRGKRTKKQWNDGVTPFLEVLNEYKPDLVIAFGFGVANNLPEAPLIKYSNQEFRKYKIDCEKEIFQCAVKHPAGGLSYSDLHRVFKIGIELVEERNNNGK